MSWRRIDTQGDIDEFLRLTHSMHDSVIVSVNYISGCGNTERGQKIFDPGNRLAVTLDSQWTDRIEMLFTEVKYFSMEGYNECYSNELFSCVLEFRTDLYGKTRDDRLIVWTDGGKFQPEANAVDLNKKNDTFVISKSLKWRFASEAEDMDDIEI